MRTKRIFVRIALVSLMVFIGSPSHTDVANAFDGTANACMKTANAAFKACKADERGSYWNTIGLCRNLPTAGESRECILDTNHELKEIKSDCFDQYASRQEICEELGSEPYYPEIDPANFVEYIDNPYLPLVPGTTLIYEGGDERIEVRVTDETKDILGVECTVVRDTVWVEGEVAEDTFDWFAQDADGNVWYFGELSMEFEEGELVSLEGSWKAGVDGALPGIVMPSDIWIGRVYRQEFLLNEAEDMGRIIDVGRTVTTGFGTFSSLVTEDWTPLEPDVFEHKFYAPGIGLVLEVNPENGDVVELIEKVVE